MGNWMFCHVFSCCNDFVSQSLTCGALLSVVHSIILWKMGLLPIPQNFFQFSSLILQSIVSCLLPGPISQILGAKTFNFTHPHSGFTIGMSHIFCIVEWESCPASFNMGWEVEFQYQKLYIMSFVKQEELVIKGKHLLMKIDRPLT